jgi:protoporphyrinogen/coproporphyrinogen III oxidase
VVVGGGISGLTVAWRLREAAQVVVLEQGAVCGGLLRAGTLAGIDLDLGAESVLARRPEAVDLMREVGLADEIVHPVTHAAQVLCEGVLVPLPSATVMGVPSSSSGLEAVLGPEGAARVAAEAHLPPLSSEGEDADRSVAAWVGERVGVRVAQRLVEPLLGGVYAGRSDFLSAQACVPALWQSAHAHGGLVAGAAALTAASAGDRRPVFAGLAGGLGVFAAALAAAANSAGVRIRTGTTVTAVVPEADGTWRVHAGVEQLEAAAVVLAVPAPVAAALLAPVSRTAAAELAAVETASVALLAAVVPRRELSGLAGSGVLVPPTEGRQVKAATFSSAKWDWVGRQSKEHVVVRFSVGRHRDETVLDGDDPAITELVLRDAAVILGRRLHPVATRVTRWSQALPQYGVGHLARVARLRAAVAEVPGLAMCGSVMDGVGIPACIAAADRAAAETARGLAADVPLTTGRG